MTLSVLCLAVMGQAAPAPTFDDVRKLLDGLESKHFRGMVYVEQAGKEKFFHAVGLADPESKRPFSRDTGICIGSIVKPMVRVALFKLIDEGKISLSDPISKFFQGVPEDKRAITVGLLAEHKAGFQDVFGGDYEPMGRDELMGKMLASKLIFTPGEKDEYSNSGFSMLSTILEKVSGKPIEELVYEVELKPLGLHKTGYVMPRWSKDDLAAGTRRSGERWGTPLDHFWYPDGPSWNLRGNGGMISSVRELARWSRGVNEFEVISKDNHKLMVPGLHTEDRARRFWASAGGNGIFNTVVVYNPGKRMAIVAASMDGRFEIESQRELVRMIHRALPELPED
jgi:CubicO group peptidase (beta-lactamase class C family)